MTTRPLPRPHPLLGLAVLLVPITTGLLPPRGPKRPQDPTAPFPRQGAWLGKEVCRDCHEDKWEEISEGWHAAVVGSDLLRGCETCHGPGEAHGLDIDNDPRLITHPPTLAPGAQSAVCAQCHRDQMALHGGDPRGFLAAGKGCTACHTVHQEIPEPPRPGLAFGARTEVARHAERVGADRCVECHPLRDRLLEHSHHHGLAAAQEPRGCETCHGPGSLHVESGGVGRLITRPDRAADTVHTCRQCHDDVHATDFHWHEREAPLLSDGLTCTTCHEIHRPVAPSRRAGSVDPDTGALVAEREPPTNRLCVTCHAPAFEVLTGTIHQSLADPGRPLTLGCGGCHEGAAAHARSGGRPELVESLRGTGARRQLETCMACHEGERHLAHVRAGSHFRHEVTCLSCHSPAAPATEVRADAEKRCASCHRDVAAEFAFPNRHPVPEGHMACSDCHDPHAARPKVRDLELRERACLRCHQQYRGPFVYEHQAGRIDGCVACHRPHGASNRRLLRQHRTQQNCLQCHADFPAFHDQTPGSVFTNCLNCHTEIHGSHLSRFFFR